MKKAVIFDLDGTLLDTLDDLTDGVNHALKMFGYPPRRREEVKKFVGNGIGKLIARSLPPDTKKSEFDKVLKEFRDYYTENCTAKTKAYSGIPELLSALGERGIKRAVVSNKNNRAVERLADKFLKGLVDEAFGEREGIERKPAPDSVLEVLRLFGCEKKDALYVGDSEVDILTSENAGVDLAAVDWGFRSRDLLAEKGAEIIISRPGDLLMYI